MFATNGFETTRFLDRWDQSELDDLRKVTDAVAFGDKLLLEVMGEEFLQVRLAVSDGSQLPQIVSGIETDWQLVSAGTTAYGYAGSALVRVDEAGSTTTLDLTDFEPNLYSSRALGVVGDQLVIGITNNEEYYLVATDGTLSNTKRIVKPERLRWPEWISSPDAPLAFFRLESDLFVTDGTAVGTRRIGDVVRRDDAIHLAGPYAYVQSDAGMPTLTKYDAFTGEVVESLPFQAMDAVMTSDDRVFVRTENCTVRNRWNARWH